MKNFLIRMCAGLLLAASVDVHAQPAGTAVPVTVDNFKRAETDLYLGGFREGRVRLESSFTTANCRRSKTRPSYGPTATRSIHRRCSISMRGR